MVLVEAAALDEVAVALLGEEQLGVAGEFLLGGFAADERLEVAPVPLTLGAQDEA